MFRNKDALANYEISVIINIFEFHEYDEKNNDNIGIWQFVIFRNNK